MNSLLQTLFSFMFFFQFFLGIHVVLASGQCTDDQRSVLFQLRDSLQFNSSLSTRLVSWDQKTDFCIWNGVTCNLARQVIGLDLSKEGIYGGINDSSILFCLEKLQMLNLAYNNFNSKPIPSRFGNLTNLVYLNLSSSDFSGQVPGEFSQMTRLEVLDLSWRFSYEVDLSLKLEKPNLAMLVLNLQRLTELYLDGVNISAHKSDWCQVISSSLPNLKVLSLSNCYLSGPIDESLHKLQSISIINLSSNDLSTHVPDFFANFTNLTIMNLRNCNLNGKFPKKVLQLPSLEILDLSGNERLHGSLLGLPKNGLLRNLVLGFTNFSNTIPESIGDLKMLSRLFLNHCRFNGRIPQSIGNLTQLSYLDLSYNSFTGRIPSFRLCKNLLHIDLSWNSLSGWIPPAHFQNLHNLVTVDLRVNTFNESLPLSLFSLPLVQEINLSDNNFEGPLVNFSNPSITLLHTLDLSSNKLEGEIPKSFFGLNKLRSLYLSSNNLRGTILTKAFQGLLNLEYLDLSYNNWSIETSSWDFNMSPFPQLDTLHLASCNLWTFPNLKNQSMLYSLDLSDNNIGGEIPSWIWASSNALSYVNISHNQLVGFQKPYMFPEFLDVLDLHSNKLSGVIPIPPPFVAYVDYSENLFSSSIPDGIGSNLTHTSFFSVSRNSLTGPIPQTICNASGLNVLDLSHNGFGGRIPECLLEFGRDLGVLQLGNNSFNGVIDGTFWSNCSLVTLDLHENSLEGKIPQSLANCKILEVLNLGNNKINDTYPCFLRNNSKLRVLILRSNRLYGGVHCNPHPSTTLEKVLQILDIAFNNFTGVVPVDWFLNWNAMMTDEDRPQSYDKYLRFRSGELYPSYYQQTVTVSMKGQELELVKILTIFTSIDISNNHFGGEIPSTIGQLKMLYILNMSHNEFTGSIPPSFGDLYQIESLDLSANKLVGEIPSELTRLPFLSSFNLSYNQLEGRIPVGPQFQTFTNDSYKGNMGLCGFPLINQSCNGSGKATTPPASTESSHDNTVTGEDLISVGVGFVVGLGILILPLIFSGRWNRWYYQHVERIFFKKLDRYYERRNRMKRAYKNPVRRL